MGLTKGRLEIEQVEWWKRELPMSDQDVAMRIAVASAFRDCGLPSNEQDVDDFLVALRHSATWSSGSTTAPVMSK
jgi:hypothetical protein